MLSILDEKLDKYIQDGVEILTGWWDAKLQTRVTAFKLKTVDEDDFVDAVIERLRLDGFIKTAEDYKEVKSTITKKISERVAALGL